MEKSNLTSLHPLVNVFIDNCISLFNISREIEKPKNLHLSTKPIGLPKNEHLYQTKYYKFYEKTYIWS